MAEINEYVNFKQGLEKNLPTELIAGTVLFTTDTHRIYLDYKSSPSKTNRIQISDLEFVSSIDTSSKGISGKLYINTSNGEMYIYITKWIKLNGKSEHYYTLKDTIDLTTSNNININDLKSSSDKIDDTSLKGALIIDNSKSLGIITNYDTSSGIISFDLLIDNKKPNNLTDNIYIDEKYQGKESTGTFEKPFKSLQSVFITFGDIINKNLILLSDSTATNQTINVYNKLENVLITGYNGSKKIECTFNFSDATLNDVRFENIDCSSNHQSFILKNANNILLINVNKAISMINCNNVNIYNCISKSIGLESCLNVFIKNVHGNQLIIDKNNSNVEILDSEFTTFNFNNSSIDNDDETNYNQSNINIKNVIFDNFTIRRFFNLELNGGKVKDYATIKGFAGLSKATLGTFEFEDKLTIQECSLIPSGLTPKQIVKVSNGRVYETAVTEADNLEDNLDAISEMLNAHEEQLGNTKDSLNSLGVVLRDKGLATNLETLNLASFVAGDVVKYIADSVELSTEITGIKVNSLDKQDPNKIKLEIEYPNLSYYCKIGDNFLVTYKSNKYNFTVLSRAYSRNKDVVIIEANKTDIGFNTSSTKDDFLITKYTHNLRIDTNDHLVRLNNGWDKLVDFANLNENYQIVQTKSQLKGVRGSDDVRPFGTTVYILDEDNIVIWVNTSSGNKWKYILDDYAKIDSPEFKGIPKTPTPTNDSLPEQIANKEYVDYKVQSLVTPINVQLGAGDNIVSLNASYGQQWQFVGQPLCYNANDIKIPVDYKFIDLNIIENNINKIKVNVETSAIFQAATISTAMLPAIDMTHLLIEYYWDGTMLIPEDGIYSDQDSYTEIIGLQNNLTTQIKYSDISYNTNKFSIYNPKHDDTDDLYQNILTVKGDTTKYLFSSTGDNTGTKNNDFYYETCVIDLHNMIEYYDKEVEIILKGCMHGRPKNNKCKIYFKIIGYNSNDIKFITNKFKYEAVNSNGETLQPVYISNIMESIIRGKGNDYPNGLNSICKVKLANIEDNKYYIHIDAIENPLIDPDDSTEESANEGGGHDTSNVTTK